VHVDKDAQLEFYSRAYEHHGPVAMSGFEVIGVVLGVLPLLISGLEHYNDGQPAFPSSPARSLSALS
jgi:hypothetical protein